MSRSVGARLLVVVLLYGVGAWTYGVVLPPLEGGDEWLQVAYVEHIRATGELPDRDASLTSPVRQQSGQPPLTYGVSAFAATARGLPIVDTQAMWAALQSDSNNWFTPPDKFNRLDNNNVFYLTNAPADDPDTARLVRTLRLFAPLWGVVGVLAAYGAAWEVWRDPRPALTAAGLFAFTPTYLHINSFPNTDGGAAALGTLALWWALRGVRRGVSPMWANRAGVILTVAGLAKVSALLTAPGIGLALLLGSYREPRRLLNLSARMVFPLLTVFGSWVAWGMLTYGDPLGTATHQFEGQAIVPPLGPLGILARTPELLLSYWGKFASAVYLHPASYAVAGGLLALAVVGALLDHTPKSPHHRQTGDLSIKREAGFSPSPSTASGGYVWLVVWTVFLVSVAGLVYWVATINFITGRLLFPAHGAVVLLIVAGLRGLSDHIWMRALAVGVPAVTGLVIGPAVISAAYRAPLPPPDDLALTRTVVDYDDTIRLTGWDAPPTITSDALVTVTLCWAVLAEPTRPAAYSLKLVRDGVPVGERTTVHGLGRYDWRRWEPGAAFCDALDVPLGNVAPGATYDLLLVLLDAETGAVDWPATTEDGASLPFPVLGQVRGAEE